MPGGGVGGGGGGASLPMTCVCVQPGFVDSTVAGKCKVYCWTLRHMTLSAEGCVCKAGNHGAELAQDAWLVTTKLLRCKKQ